MLSRVANSIHWMSRYIERAENIARFIDVNLNLILDVPVAFEQQWAPLVSVTGDEAAFRAAYGETSGPSVIRFLTFDRNNPNSMISCLTAARENARAVRPTISSDMWEQVNRTHLMLREADTTGRVLNDPASFFSHFKKACHLFLGTTDATLTHGEAWHFIRMGRLLERADKTSRILDVKYFILLPRADYVGSPYDSLQWIALLKSASALEMYRKRYHRITPREVAAFLVLDAEFPRSMRHCVTKAEESLAAIMGGAAGGGQGAMRSPAGQKLGRLRAELDYTDIDEIFEYGLHESLDVYQARLNGVGQAIHDTFFDLPASVGDDTLRPATGARA